MSHPDPTRLYGENETDPFAKKKRDVASKVFSTLKRPPEGKSLRRHQQKYWKNRSKTNQLTPKK